MNTSYTYKYLSALVAACVITPFLGFLAASCVFPAPELDPATGKIVAHADGTTKWDYKFTPGNAKKQTDRALESKGFKRYKADVAQIAAKNWTTISMWAGILAGAFTLGWYFTKIRELGGAAIISLLFSLVAVCMAELVSNIGKLLLFVAAAFIIGLGIYIRKKSITSLIRKWTS